MARKPVSVVGAAEKGTRLDMLRALQDRVAEVIEDEGTPGYALSALVRTAMDLAKDIEDLESKEQADQVDRRVIGSGDEAFKLEVI